VPLALLIYVKSNPNSRLSKVLKASMSPRTDVKNMTSSEIFAASRFFFVAGGYFFGISFLSFYLSGMADKTPTAFAIYLFMLPVFFCLMGFVGGCILGICGLFKKE
jgi:hypothetical protein